MSLLSQLERLVGLEKKRRRKPKRKAKAKRRTPGRRADGQFKKKK